MRLLLVVVIFILASLQARGQIHILGKDTRDQFLSGFWTVNANASNVIQGLNANAGTNKFLNSLLPDIVSAKTLSGDITGTNLFRLKAWDTTLAGFQFFDFNFTNTVPNSNGVSRVGMVETLANKTLATSTRFDGTGMVEANGSGSTVSFVARVPRNLFTATGTNQVVNTTTETSVLPTGVGTNLLAANHLVVGRTIIVEAWGFHNTKATGAGTLNVRLKYGSTVLAATGAQTLTDAIANKMWRFTAEFVCQTTGAVGTVFAHGHFQPATGAVALANWPMLSTTTGTIDTTAATAITVTAQYGTADLDNHITTTNFRLTSY